MTSQATQLHEDRLLILWWPGIKILFPIETVLRVEQARCHPQVFGFDSSPKNIDSLMKSHTNKHGVYTVYTHNYIYTKIHTQFTTVMTVVYCLWSPEAQIIEQDYMFSPSSFFLYS